MMTPAVLVFALVALLGMGGMAMPPIRMQPPDVLGGPNGRTSQYEQLYRSYLDPLQLYRDTPPQYAPLISRGRNRWSNLQRYTGLVQSHSAYINPRAGDALNTVMLRAHSLTSSPTPPTLAQQRKSQPLTTSAWSKRY